MTRFFLFFILLITGSSVFASPIKEAFLVRNYSSQTVIITVEYNDDPDKFFYPPGAFLSWRQNLSIYDINLAIAAHHSADESEFRVRPNQIRTIIDYYPIGNIDGNEAYTRLDQIPFMDKMRGIYKSLIIATEDGQKVITLENLGEQIIKKTIGPSGEVSYHLEIFDYDLGIGRPASEW
jgi:hypothetical protein